MFKLHPRLNADTIPLTKLGICGVYLMNDKRYPWIILIPEINGITELHELDDETYHTVTDEIKTISEILNKLYSPKKINIGALGNVVSQLHIHIIARYENDQTWPGPVWGVGAAEAYTEAEIENCKNDILIQLK